MIDGITTIYHELKPGGVILLLLLAIGVLGWSWALWWTWTVRGCSNTHRSFLQNWIRSFAGDTSVDRALSRHERNLLQQLIEPAQRYRMVNKSRLRDLLRTVINGSRSRYQSGKHLVGVCAAVLPLLGLFGTLIGIIQSFDALALFGTQNVKQLSTGISKALLTTQAGLLLALPLVFFHRYMNAQVERHTKNMELIAHCLLRHRRSIPEIVNHVYQDGQNHE